MEKKKNETMAKGTETSVPDMDLTSQLQQMPIHQMSQTQPMPDVMPQMQQMPGVAPQMQYTPGMGVQMPIVCCPLIMNRQCPFISGQAMGMPDSAMVNPYIGGPYIGSMANPYMYNPYMYNPEIYT